MIKTLRTIVKQDREGLDLPKGVQDIIPVRKIYEDGIFQIGKNKFSKTYQFDDINYYVASKEDKEAMFLEYSELLNALDSSATTKLTINNRRLNREKYITISITKKNIEEARNYFRRAGNDLTAHFNRLGATCTELEMNDRLRVIYDFYRSGEETAFHFDIHDKRKGMISETISARTVSSMKRTISKSASGMAE